jgi:hypothetical protein
MTEKKSKLKFKVVGSYTIQTFYTKEFEIQDQGIDDQLKLMEMVEEIALEDESEDGLLGWEEDWFKVIGDTFYIEKVIPLGILSKELE